MPEDRDGSAGPGAGAPSLAASGDGPRIRSGATRGRGSIHRAFISLALWQTAIVLLVAAALVGSIYNTQRSIAQLTRAISGVRAVEEVEISLFQATRYHQLVAETGDRIWLERMVAAEGELVRRLQEARELAGPPEERALVERLTAEVQSIRENVLGQPPNLGTLRRADVSSALDTAEQLIALNERLAAETVDAMSRWNRVATAIFLSAIGLSFLGLPLTLIYARRMLYRPVRVLRAALAQRSVDSDEHLPATGPSELQQITAAINDLVDRIAEQRAQQLTFLAAVAHDLRNPLASLRTAAQLAARDAEGEAQVRRAAVITRAVDRLDRLVGDLLEFSRIGSGRFDLNPVEADLRDVVRETVALFADASERHEVRMELPDHAVFARYDPVRIGQVLGNLISNAIKYSPGGGPVDVRLRARDGRAEIRVEDRGIGVAPEDRERIFTTFGRSSGIRAEIPGMGLGLAVARRLARAHGGEIELEDRPGGGSVFSLVLPLGQKALPEQQAAAVPID